MKAVNIAVENGNNGGWIIHIGGKGHAFQKGDPMIKEASGNISELLNLYRNIFSNENMAVLNLHKEIDQNYAAGKIPLETYERYIAFFGNFFRLSMLSLITLIRSYNQINFLMNGLHPSSVYMLLCILKLNRENLQPIKFNHIVAEYRRMGQAISNKDKRAVLKPLLDRGYISEEVSKEIIEKKDKPHWKRKKKYKNPNPPKYIKINTKRLLKDFGKGFEDSMCVIEHKTAEKNEVYPSGSVFLTDAKDRKINFLLTNFNTYNYIESLRDAIDKDFIHLSTKDIKSEKIRTRPRR